MNCLDFRRAAAIDPRRLDAPAAAHLLQCEACRDFQARALEFEHRLDKALRVPVPRGLSEKLIERRVRTPRAARWYTLAAAGALAVALAAIAALMRDDPLARAGIDFVVYEEAQAIADAKPTDAAMLERVAREMSVSLPVQLGEIRYICFYPFAGGGAHHVLLKTPLGKATLLLIPELRLASRLDASALGLDAAVMPVPGGAVAIIAASPRSIARIEALLKSLHNNI
jgi:hypothetical protein